MLSISVFEFAKFLVGNLIVPDKLKEAIRDSKRVTLVLVSIKLILKSPHKIIFVDAVYNLLKLIQADLKSMYNQLWKIYRDR